ncbi:MAG TPA: insulinase family protein, partial [Saprospiraceae bacterium]|nr:insulinase family protein [Saprospiraceae bacterium]
ALFAGLFKKHTYGTQTTLGKPEHLKNPSLVTIRKFYDTYYVPNNMVVILAGDIDMSETIKLVDKYFGDMVPKKVPEFKFEPEDEITKPEEVLVYSPDEEMLAFGFRFPNTNDKEAVLADLVANILYNGKSGLIDKNLVKAQKVLEANGFNYLLSDYGIMGFTGKPLEGQTLTQLKDLILAEIEGLKKGNFDQDLIKATVNNLKVTRIREQESPMNVAFVFNDLFVTKTHWADYLKKMDDMGKITKDEVVAFANKWFKNNYVAVYKLTGTDPENKKVDKPEITSIEINRTGTSSLFKDITESPNKPLAPVFLDFKKDIKFGSIHKDVPVWSVPNTINNLFTQYFVFDMGSHHIKKLPLAIEYLKYIGSKTKSNENINKELYNLAVDFNIFTSDEQVYVSISGLEENRQKALTIIEDLMRNPVPDQKALDNLINAKIKERNDKTLNKESIFWEALDNYVNYGPKNPYNSVLSNDEMRAIKAKELTDLIKSLFTYKHKIYYYGPKEVNKLALELKKSHILLPTLKNYPKKTEFPKLKADENTIYFVDYDMSQVEISMQRWDDKKYDPKKTPIIRAFNEYYGGSMTSVVFQEIREAKALAYSTYGYYGTPAKKEDPYSAGFYVGTQADKLSIAFDAMNDLLNNFKESEQNWQVGKTAIKQSMESDRITKTSILFNYQTALKRGIDYDIRKDIYQQIDGIALSDLKTFHSETMQNKPWNIRVIGSKERLNMSDMAKYGKVVELSLKDVFGFEVDKKELKP